MYWLYVSIYSACSILLNFLIYSQSTAKISSNIAVVKACCEKSSISSRVGIRDKIGISSKIGIEASPSKNIFRPFKVTLLLYRVLSMVYSGGVGEWASPY